MNDFWGNKLSVGDEVALEAKNYRNIVKGVVIGFTPQQVMVS